MSRRQIVPTSLILLATRQHNINNFNFFALCLSFFASTNVFFLRLYHRICVFTILLDDHGDDEWLWDLDTSMHLQRVRERKNERKRTTFDRIKVQCSSRTWNRVTPLTLSFSPQVQWISLLTSWSSLLLTKKTHQAWFISIHSPNPFDLCQQ